MACEGQERCGRYGEGARHRSESVGYPLLCGRLWKVVEGREGGGRWWKVVVEGCEGSARPNLRPNVGWEVERTLPVLG